ncbi:hypothetical protein H2199_003719 [Coniosporium tulheliwenetii]|uniref:Uncharacterized protein n=1 Tax=Coniosporium tulheliwenetii TaxID=3383036 RepID=A0ACC2ZBP0_9PEZI|nr:hypothetical protein H2199_003719 [Cladosporium sp. JES 115]
MDASEDDDLRLQRASAGFYSLSLARILWKPPSQGNKQRVHRSVKVQELDQVVLLIEPFQEDPQLLDAHLKHIIPPLVDAYLQYLQAPSQTSTIAGTVPLSSAVSRILYTLCKVRGEKIVTGFLNNEPRYLELILTRFEQGINNSQIGTVPNENDGMRWEERYVLLLWLSHLMLTPFDLASISSKHSTDAPTSIQDLDLPANLPAVASRLIPSCIQQLNSATRERDAAALALVRLCIRPDMRKIGLLNAIVQWALSWLDPKCTKQRDIHQMHGVLSFISRLVASATYEELGHLLRDIHDSCQHVLTYNSLSFVKSSAVARKLIIKTTRNIVVHYVQSLDIVQSPDLSTLFEEVIDFLLEAVADGDTPVRFAASKALSIVAMKLESNMRTEVIDAILSYLNVDVLWEGTTRNLAMVNPLRWHGLTLALSHLLYRKAPPAEQLPDVLNALMLALTFEQRAATGGSIGSNVRDAACFGIWAISRRYTTAELLAVDTTSVRAAQAFDHRLSVPQILAIELLQTSCLDPAGNIRRGSSAALQELIGRHPDIVVDGIPLVQIVDYHAVGPRDRAMTEVAVKAAQLDSSYWQALFNGLLGRLSVTQPFAEVRSMIQRISKRLAELGRNDVEERHGLLMSLASVLHGCVAQIDFRYAKQNQLPNKMLGDIEVLDGLWSLLQSYALTGHGGTLPMKLEERDFKSAALRPELTAVAICSLLSALALTTLRLWDMYRGIEDFPHGETVITLLTLCLTRTEDSVLQVLPSAVDRMSRLLSLEELLPLNQTWLTSLIHSRSPRNSGYALALGAMYGNLEPESAKEAQIIEVLTSRCTPAVEVEARVAALQSLRLLIPSVAKNSLQQGVDDLEDIKAAISTALNDYTINERGDIGSLVRLEALNAVSTAAEHGFFDSDADCRNSTIAASVIRLSLEKLDKVRSPAAKCLRTLRGDKLKDLGNIMWNDEQGVSSYAYFASAVNTLRRPTPTWVMHAVLEGYISSAGVGSESVLQASRLALVEMLEELFTHAEEPTVSVLEICTALVEIFKENIAVDRVVLPLMEVLAFLFDMQILQRLGSTFKWRNLLSLVQKAHFKSQNMVKLSVALDLYRGLADVDATRADVIAKLTSMLLHPFPKIRIAAAETLLAAEVTKTCYACYNAYEDARNAPDTIKAATRQLGGLCKLLVDLQNIYGNATQALPSLLSVQGDVERCRAEIDHRVEYVWKKRKIQAFVSWLEFYQSIFKLAVANDSLRVVVDIHQNVKKVDDTLDGMHQDLAADKRRQLSDEALKWLSPLDFAQRQKELYHLRRRHGTGIWILREGALRSCSVVVNYLLEQRVKHEEIGVAFIYCESEEQANQAAGHLLGSLLQQLAFQHDSVRSDVLGLYQSTKDVGAASDEEVMELLLRTRDYCSKVFLVIDGLDELRSDVRQVLLGFFSRAQTAFIHVLVTGRPFVFQGNSVSDRLRNEVRPPENDIRTFVQSYVQDSDDLNFVIDGDRSWQGRLVKIIVEKAAGQFALAYMYLTRVASETCKADAMAALANLGKTLPEEFDRTMKRIK